MVTRKIEIDGKRTEAGVEGIEIKRKPQKIEPHEPKPLEEPKGDEESLLQKGEAGKPNAIGQIPQVLTQSPGLSKKKWIFIGIGSLLIIVIISSLFSTSNKFKKWNGYVFKGPVVTLRKCPEINCEIVGNLIVGDQVEVISQNKDWYRVRTKEKGEGYIKASFISKDKPIIGFEDYLGRAAFYININNYQKVFDELEQAKKLKPDSSDPYMVAARAWLAQGKKEKAFKEFQEALKRDIKSSHPIVVNLKTAYGPIKLEPKDIKSVEGREIKLKDGSKFEGDISLELK